MRIKIREATPEEIEEHRASRAQKEQTAQTPTPEPNEDRTASATPPTPTPAQDAAKVTTPQTTAPIGAADDVITYDFTQGSGFNATLETSPYAKRNMTPSEARLKATRDREEERARLRAEAERNVKYAALYAPDPDAERAKHDLSVKTGIPMHMMEDPKVHDAAERTSRMIDIATHAKTMDIRLIELLARDPYAMRFTLDDIREMQRKEGFWEGFVNTFRRGLLQTRVAKAYADVTVDHLAQPTDTNAEKNSLAKQYRMMFDPELERQEKELAILEARAFNTDRSFFTDMAYGVPMILGQNAETALNASLWDIGVASAVALGTYGLGLPASTAILYGTTAGKAAGAASSTYQFWKSMYGEAVIDALNTTYTDGRPLTDDDLTNALKWGFIASIPTTALERAQWGIVTRGTPLRGALRDITKRAADGSVLNKMLLYGAHWAGADLAETATEVSQELVTGAAQNIIAATSTGGRVEAPGAKEMIERAVQTAVQSAVSFMLPTLYGSSREARAKIRDARKARRAEEDVRAIADATADLKINLRDRGAAAAYIDAMTGERRADAQTDAGEEPTARTRATEPRTVWISPDDLDAVSRGESPTAAEEETKADAQADAQTQTETQPDGVAVNFQNAIPRGVSEATQEEIDDVLSALADGETQNATPRGVSEATQEELDDVLSTLAETQAEDLAPASDEFLAEFGISRERYEEARQLGTDIEMTIGDAVVGMNRTGTLDAMSGALKAEQGGMRAADGRRARAREHEDMERIAREADEMIARLAEDQRAAEEAEDAISAQLLAVSREGANITEDEARAQAKLAAAGLTAAARRFTRNGVNMTAMDLMRELGLKWDYEVKIVAGDRQVTTVVSALEDRTPWEIKRDQITEEWNTTLDDLIAGRENKNIVKAKNKDGTTKTFLNVMNNTPIVIELANAAMNDTKLEKNVEGSIISMPMDIEAGKLFGDENRKGSEKKHGIDIGIMRKLPELIADPLAIFEYHKNPKNPQRGGKSKSIVILTEAELDNGAGIVVAIRIEKRGRSQKYNRISTVYAAQTYDDPKTAVINNSWLDKYSKVLYMDETRTSLDVLQQTYSSSPIDPERRPDTSNMKTKADLVKRREEFGNIYLQRAFEGKQHQDIAAGRFQASPGEARITLTPDANASTGVHEMGHLWLHLLRMQADRFVDDDDLQRDWRTVRDFLGWEQGQQSFTTEQHEKFATAFTQYMREGRAPTTALESVFAKFKSWLAELWRALTGDPATQAEIFGGEISDELREVFDRILATEDQIAMTAQERSLDPSERDAASPRRRDASDSIARSASAAALADQLDRLAAITPERRETIEEEVRAELADDPAWFAVATLQGDETDPTSFKLDENELADRYGASLLESLPLGISSTEGGVSVEAAARRFGFGSADEFISSISGHDDIDAEVRRRVRQRIDAETGFDASAIDDAANDGFYSPEAADRLADEAAGDILDAMADARAQREEEDRVLDTAEEELANERLNIWSPAQILAAIKEVYPLDYWEIYGLYGKEKADAVYDAIRKRYGKNKASQYIKKPHKTKDQIWEIEQNEGNFDASIAYQEIFTKIMGVDYLKIHWDEETGADGHAQFEEKILDPIIFNNAAYNGSKWYHDATIKQKIDDRSRLKNAFEMMDKMADRANASADAQAAKKAERERKEAEREQLRIAREYDDISRELAGMIREARAANKELDDMIQKDARAENRDAQREADRLSRRIRDAAEEARRDEMKEWIASLADEMAAKAREKVGAENGRTVKNKNKLPGYVAAERNARAQWKEAVKEGDFETARAHKRRELWAHALVAATREYAARWERDMNAIRKGIQLTERSTSDKTIDASALGQIRGIAESLRMRPRNSRSERRQALADFAAAAEMDGRPLDIAAGVLNESSLKDWGDMTADELHDAAEAVRALDAWGRATRTIWLNGRAQNIMEVSEELEAMIKAHSLHFGDKDGTNDLNRQTTKSRIRTLMDRIKSGVAEHLKPEFIIRALDGWNDNGQIWRTLFKPFVDAEAEENKRLRALREGFAKLVEDTLSTRDEDGNITEHGADRLRRAQNETEFFDGVGIDPGFDVWSRRQQISRGVPGSRAEYEEWRERGRFRPEGLSMTRAQLICMALNCGNETNMERVITGEGFRSDNSGSLATESTPSAELNMMLGRLTNAEWDFVQGVWDLLDTMWPDAAEVHKRVTGREADRVEPRQLLVFPSDTPGEHRRLKGGYYPIMYDWSRGIGRDADEKRTADQLFGGSFAIAYTEHGHLKSRAKSTGERLRYDLEVISEHFMQVAHDIAFRQPIIDVNRVLRTTRVKEAITASVGEEAYAQFHPWLVAMSHDDHVPKNVWERVVRRMRMNAQIVALGFNPRSALNQLLGLLPAANRIGVRGVWRGFWEMYHNPLRIARERQWIWERSEQMRDRADSRDRDIREFARSLEARGGGLRGLDAAFFSFVSRMDELASLPIWRGAYERAIREGKDESAAIEYADSIVRNTQDVGAAKDLSDIQRGGPLWKLFTSFYNGANVMFNMMHEEVWKLRAGRLTRWEAARDIFWLLVLPAVIAWYREQDDADDDDAPWLRSALGLASAVVSVPAQTIPFVRDAYDAFAGGKYRAPSGLSFLVAIGELGAAADKAIDAAIDDEKNVDWRRLLTSANAAAGLAMGYPSQQINRIFSSMYDLLSGERDADLTGQLWRAAFGGRRAKLLTAAQKKERQRQQNIEKARERSAERDRARAAAQERAKVKEKE